MKDSETIEVLYRALKDVEAERDVLKAALVELSSQLHRLQDKERENAKPDVAAVESHHE